MTTQVELIEHSPNYLDLAIRSDPNVVRYRLNAARTINTAYVGQGKPGPVNGVVGVAGTDQLIVVERDALFRSMFIKRRKLGMLDESNRGLTRIIYDPDEYVGATLDSAPPDQDTAYVRVQEFRYSTGAYGSEGPIFIVPPSNFFNTPKPLLNIAGTAPQTTTPPTAGSKPPSGSMVIVYPRMMNTFRITNDGANSLFIAFDPNWPMRLIAASATLEIDNAYTKYLVLAASGGTSAFSFFGSVVNSGR